MRCHWETDKKTGILFFVPGCWGGVDSRDGHEMDACRCPEIGRRSKQGKLMDDIEQIGMEIQNHEIIDKIRKLREIVERLEQKYS